MDTPVLKMEGRITAGNAPALEKMLKAIPDDTYSAHGDCHPGNFMMDSNGSLSAIDLGSAGTGIRFFH